MLFVRKRSANVATATDVSYAKEHGVVDSVPVATLSVQKNIA